MKPKWKHDCTACTFIGAMFMSKTTADWYVCGDTVLARMSDEGSDYWAMPISVATDDQSLIAQDSDGTVAYTDHRVLARFMLSKLKERQEKFDLLFDADLLKALVEIRKLDTPKETT